MKIVLALLFVFASSAQAKWPAGFNIRFDSTGYKNTSFIDLPRNVTAAQAQGWVQHDRPEGPEEYTSLKLWCPSDDPTVGVLVDDLGYTCGLQIALRKDYLSEIAFDLDIVGLTNWTTTVEGETSDYWTIAQYFVSGEFLATDSATRAASRKSSEFLQEPYIFLTGTNKKIYKVPTDPSKFVENNFTTQKCIAGMGIHNYYNMSKDLVCESEYMYPWFLIHNNKQFFGSGFFINGVRTFPSDKLNYMERYFEISDLESVFEAASDCVFKYGNDPGLLEVHIYYVEDGFTIPCDE